MTPTEEIQAIKDATQMPVAYLASLSGIKAQRLQNIMRPQDQHRAQATPDELYKVKVALLTLAERIQALAVLPLYQPQERDADIVVEAVEPTYPRMESDGRIVVKKRPTSDIPAGLSDLVGGDGSSRFK